VKLVGELAGSPGLTLVTAHVVPEWQAAQALQEKQAVQPPKPTTLTFRAPATDGGGRFRTYLLIHSGLGRVEPGVGVGSRLTPGSTLGYAPSAPEGETADWPTEIVLAARLVHEGLPPDVDVGSKPTDVATSLPIDLRNVLPLRAP
jgi:hypothetical protein